MFVVLMTLVAIGVYSVIVVLEEQMDKELQDAIDDIICKKPKN